MGSIDVYPSTSDSLPPIAGGQDDLVLTILKRAYKRYKDHGTDDSYLVADEKGRIQACAFGSVAEAAGVDAKAYDEAVQDGSGMGLGDSYRGDYEGFEAVMRAQKIEADTIAAAREAMRLLDKAAVDLFPHTADYGSWTGPLEELNQDDAKFASFKVRKQAVKLVYVLAIECRKGTTD